MPFDVAKSGGGEGGGGDGRGVYTTFEVCALTVGILSMGVISCLALPPLMWAAIVAPPRFPLPLLVACRLSLVSCLVSRVSRSDKLYSVCGHKSKCNLFCAKGN